MMEKSQRMRHPRRSDIQDLDDIDKMLKADLESQSLKEVPRGGRRRQDRRPLTSGRNDGSDPSYNRSHRLHGRMLQEENKYRRYSRSGRTQRDSGARLRSHDRFDGVRFTGVLRRRTLLLVFAGFGLLACHVQDIQLHRSLYDFARRLCGVNYVYERDSYTGYWETELNPPNFNDYISSPRAFIAPDITTPKSVAYVVTLRSCPEDLMGCHHDPGRGFYEAAAVLQYHLCEAHRDATNSSYNDCTLYAIVHREAIYCRAPSGALYDRVKVLEDLGYFVKVWGAGVGEADISDPYIRSTIGYDSGVNDYTIFNAWRIDLHDILILVDFSTLMLNRPDDLYDNFIANTTLQAMYTREYATSFPTGKNMGANLGFFLLKPSNDTFSELNTLISESWYSTLSGWEGSGVGGFDCAMGSQGILTYKFAALNATISQEIDRCRYGNGNENPINVDSGACRDGSSFCEDCRDKNVSEIFIATPRTVCGEPWSCYYDEDWDSSTKPLCETFLGTWYEHRWAFEQRYMGRVTQPNGTYYPGIFLGYCSEEGWEGYEMMLPDNSLGECIDGEKARTRATLEAPENVQNLTLGLTTGLYSGNGVTCVSGYLTIPSYWPLFNIAIIVDTSGSTNSTLGDTAVGDMNNDGLSNTALDAEIAAVIELTETLLATTGLGNETVNIGLISFGQNATYHGQYSPEDPNDPDVINPTLYSKLVSLIPGGQTNFDDSLAKAVDFFTEAASGRTNILYFLSDGKSNTCDSNDLESCTEDVDGESHNRTALLDLLEDLQVIRYVFGVGPDSSTQTDSALDSIDNTIDFITNEKAVQVNTTDALLAALKSNPVIGTIIGFDISVNGLAQPYVNETLLASGPTGHWFGNFLVTGLDQTYGARNVVNATVTIDVDGNYTTESDQYQISAGHIVWGTVTNYIDPTPAPTASPTSWETDVVYGLQPSCNTTNSSMFNICLDLTSTTGRRESWMAAFGAARDKYESIIIGDFTDRPSNTYGPTPTCNGGYPETFDDVYICAQDAIFDGPGDQTNILGSAGVYWARGNGTNPITGDVYWTALTGYMEFDTYDIPNLMAQNRFNDIVRHEMGHVLGIGTLWQYNGLYNETAAPGVYASGTKAEEAWQNMGCNGTLPVETDNGPGTAHSHWDETCLENEMMTGFTDSPMVFSKVSIGSLEDIGYTVDYSNADNYTLDDLGTCDSHCPAAESPSRRLRPIRRRLPLTSEGESKVKNFAKERLAEKRAMGWIDGDPPESTMFVGGDHIDVVYSDNGQILVAGLSWDEVQ